MFRKNQNNAQVAVDRPALELVGSLSSQLTRAIAALLASKIPDAMYGTAGGELISVRDRLTRLRQQLVKLAAPSDKKEQKHPTNGESVVPTTPSSSTVLAEIRLILDEVEDVVAVLLPHRSGSIGRTRFLGKQRMTAVDASEIRTNFQSFGRESVFKRWCLDTTQDPKGGIAGGGGLYTRNQVSAVLANDVGGHRRRRGLAHNTRST